MSARRFSNRSDRAYACSTTLPTLWPSAASATSCGALFAGEVAAFGADLPWYFHPMALALLSGGLAVAACTAGLLHRQRDTRIMCALWLLIPIALILVTHAISPWKEYRHVMVVAPLWLTLLATLCHKRVARVFAEPRDTGAAGAGLGVSVVVPTFREAGNLVALAERVAAALRDGPDWELLVVDDDSRDGTEQVMRQLSATLPARLHVRNQLQRDLSRSVLLGFRLARFDRVVVMDADLSHPPERIPDLLAALEAGAEVALGSRYVEGGLVDSNWSRTRALGSRLATTLARPLVACSDPLSGFFRIWIVACCRTPICCIRTGTRSAWNSWCGDGWRCARCRIDFQDRRVGASKMTLRTLIAYLGQLLRLYVFRLRHDQQGPTGLPREAGQLSRTTETCGGPPGLDRVTLSRPSVGCVAVRLGGRQWLGARTPGHSRLPSRTCRRLCLGRLDLRHRTPHPALGRSPLHLAVTCGRKGRTSLLAPSSTQPSGSNTSFGDSAPLAIMRVNLTAAWREFSARLAPAAAAGGSGRLARGSVCSRFTPSMWSRWPGSSSEKTCSRLFSTSSRSTPGWATRNRPRRVDWCTALRYSLQRCCRSRSRSPCLPPCSCWGWWRTGNVTRRDVARLLPFFAVAAGITAADLFFYWSQSSHPFDYSVVERALIASRALWLYLAQLFWPVSLPILYSRWEVSASDPAGWAAVAAGCVLFTALWRGRRYFGRGPLAALIFFVLTLSPVLSLLDFGFLRIAFLADRFQYLASLGPIALVAAVIARSMQRFRGPGQITAIAVLLGIVAALCTQTWRQAEVYRSELAFAQHISAANPAHYFRTASTRGRTRAGRPSSEGTRRSSERRPFSRGRQVGPARVRLCLPSATHYSPTSAPLRRKSSCAGRLPPSLRTSVERLRLARALVAQARYDEALLPCSGNSRERMPPTILL